MKRWEYLVVLINGEQVVMVNEKKVRATALYTFLNEKGSAGWKIAGVRGPHSGPLGAVVWVVLLERPILPPPEEV